MTNPKKANDPISHQFRPFGISTAGSTKLKTSFFKLSCIRRFQIRSIWTLSPAIIWIGFCSALIELLLGQR